MNPTTVAHRPWPGPAFPYVVGESTRMQDVYDVMTRVAEGDANGCTEGESGTGKELIAETLHAVGPRRDRPFVTLDCAAIPDVAMDRELSSHVRAGVTLFLDGIGELTPHLQARLLHVIRTEPQVRVIAPTNRDLRQAIPHGRLLGDRYYCTPGLHAELPALEALEQRGWNRTAAARLLGISVRGLQYKLQRYLGESTSIVGAP